MVINPHYFHGIEYEPARDFVLVAPLAAMPFVLLAGSGVPADTAPRLGEWLKVRPGEINYGSSGDGSVGHLAGELFRRATGVNIVHVPYNGGIAALSGLATDQVSLMFAALPLALPYVSAGHFKRAGHSEPPALRAAARAADARRERACPNSKWRPGSACSARRACRLPPPSG